MAHGIPWYLRGRVVIGLPVAVASAYWISSTTLAAGKRPKVR